MNKNGMHRILGSLFFLLFAMGEAVASEAPWEKFFTTGLINAKGESVDVQKHLDGKLVCLYFSAAWCGPCRSFTPKLMDFYEKNREFMEVVFVSRDRDEESCLKYMKSYPMPWLAVPWEAYEKDGNNLISQLYRDFKGKAVPVLAVLSRGGPQALSFDGKRDITSLPEDSAKMFLSRDPFLNANFKRKQREKSGKHMSDSEYQGIIDELRKEHAEGALKYAEKFKASVNPTARNHPPSWDDLLHEHYALLRQEKVKAKNSASSKK